MRTLFNIRHFSLFLVLGIFLATIATKTMAENRWVIYKAETALFKVRLPNEYEAKSWQLRNSNETIVQGEEVIVSLDQRPYKNAIKNYIVKYDQTIGNPFSEQEALNLIQQELDLYAAHYQDLGGVIKSQEHNISTYGGQAASEIHIAYNDPELGVQGVRARIIFTDTAKFQQILTGPDNFMYALKSKEFFESLDIKGGLMKRPGDFKDEWTKHTSPFNLFSVYLPPISEPYAPNPPHIESEDKAELMRYAFTDPIRHQKIFFRIYGYKMNANLTFSDVEKILFKRHIHKHTKSLERIKITRGYNEDGTPVMETRYNIPPPENFPYVNLVRLKCLFKDQHIIVQEIMGSDPLVNSVFMHNVSQLVEFHPEQISQPAK